MEDGDYQTTAYAALGLTSSPRTPVVARALSGSAAFLEATQTAAGGWSYPPEFGEINSEVLMALGVLKVDEGLHKGFTDPNPDRGKDTGKHKAEPAP